MQYKLLALDVDGTLLDPQGQITPRVKQAVQAAVASGCLVTLATGRRQRPARAFAQELGLKMPLILYTGSLIYDTASETALLHRPMSPEILRQALTIVKKAGLRPAVLQSPLEGEFIYLGPDEDDDLYSRQFAESKVRADMVRRCSQPDLELVAAPLIVSIPGPLATGARLSQALPEQSGWNIFHYPLRHPELDDFYGFDLVPPGVSKGDALRWLAAHFGIDQAETMAVGDGLNDLELLKAAGLGVAMGNAEPQLKALAGTITAPNWRDGVAEAIERFIL